MGTAKDSERTRARIVAAASELFAAYGYHAVTVRDILQKAKAHSSALNYHFASKEALYREVLFRASEAPEYALLDLERLRRMAAPKALHEVMKAWLRDYGRTDAGGWRAKLVDRECLEPSAAFQEVVETRILPEFEFVAETLGRAVGHPAQSKEIRLVVLGLYRQVITVTLYRQLLDNLGRDFWEEIHQGDWLAGALTTSAIAAAKALIKEKAC